jgi:hypothetical protein
MFALVDRAMLARSRGVSNGDMLLLQGLTGVGNCNRPPHRWPILEYGFALLA